MWCTATGAAKSHDGTGHAHVELMISLMLYQLMDPVPLRLLQLHRELLS